MNLLLNLVWLILGGFVVVIAYLLGALLLCITIIGIPFGIQAFKLAGFSLWPFGRTVVRSPEGGCLEVGFNILWLVLFGWGTLLPMLNLPEGIRTLPAAICGGLVFLFAGARAIGPSHTTWPHSSPAGCPSIHSARMAGLTDNARCLSLSTANRSPGAATVSVWSPAVSNRCEKATDALPPGSIAISSVATRRPSASSCTCTGRSAVRSAA